MVSCHYCKIYQAIKEPLRRIERKNGKVYYHRHCIKVGKEIQSDSPTCEFFTPAKFFWCERESNWMFILSCLNREDCKCLQKEDVLDSIRGFDIGKEFNMKPRLVLKNKEKPKDKPKLKLKTKKKVILLKRKKPVLIRRVK